MAELQILGGHTSDDEGPLQAEERIAEEKGSGRTAALRRLSVNDDDIDIDDDDAMLLPG
jgi:hypothetical protein